MRKFEIASLQADGSVRRTEHIGPAIPIFESAFTAFSHGTLMNTTRGPVAVEDLEPGMKLITREHGAQPVLWVGTTRLVPQAAETTAHDARMTRVMADAFGFTRPEHDLMLGPAARMLKKAPGESVDQPELIPVSTLADGMGVISILPPRPVAAYHLCLRKHSTIFANGLEMESFHPGAGFERNMGPNMLSLFLSFFPHIEKPADFGQMSYQRLPLISPLGLEVA